MSYCTSRIVLPASASAPLSPREALEFQAHQLRFDPPLEALYRVQHLRRVAGRTRAWFTANAVMTACLAIPLRSRGPVSRFEWLLLLIVLMPTALSLVALVWSPYRSRLFLRFAPSLWALFSAALGFEVAFEMGAGHPELLALLAVNGIACFCFAGLFFKASVRASLGLSIAFAAGALGCRMPLGLSLESLCVLLATQGLALWVYRDIERGYRKSHVEEARTADLVDRDPLSGLMNRRHFDERLRTLWALGEREHKHLAVMMIDIDHFKRYNDTRGHQAGDLALQKVAQMVQKFARRPLDVAVRYGGEEFALILYDLSAQHVQAVAARLLEGVQKLRVAPAQKTQDEPDLTVSIGVAWLLPSAERAASGLLQLADEALYAAKQSGRNCVKTHQAEDHRHMRTGIFVSPAERARTDVMKRLGIS
jgi:diguanylate cyclase (GGDEF)-like protein